MFKTCLIFLFILTILSVKAQNLISNGDFEHYTQLPEFAGQYYLCTGWSNCNGFGTPDYFNIQGSGPSHLPENFISTVYPHGGDAVMGFSIYDSSFANFREYISTELTSPLTPGLEYVLSFFVTNGNPPFLHGGLGSDHFSVAFSTVPLQQPDPNVISFTPQYTYNGFLFNSEWQQLDFGFTADSAYRYITIGCFMQDSGQHIEQFYPAISFPSAYYFLDDISLNLYTGLPESGRKDEIRVYPNPFTVKLHIAADARTMEFLLIDMSLKQVLRESFAGDKTVLTSHLSPGVYFYEVRDNEGIRQKGKLVKF